jgi:hypothetical protein
VKACNIFFSGKILQFTDTDTVYARTLNRIQNSCKQEKTAALLTFDLLCLNEKQARQLRLL